MLVPSAPKNASAGPPGVDTFQTPTMGWFAILASWAAAGRAAMASATVSPPAPSPARAVRRETALDCSDEVMILLLLVLMSGPRDESIRTTTPSLAWSD